MEDAAILLGCKTNIIMVTWNHFHFSRRVFFSRTDGSELVLMVGRGGVADSQDASTGIWGVPTSWQNKSETIAAQRRTSRCCKHRTDDLPRTSEYEQWGFESHWFHEFLAY